MAQFLLIIIGTFISEDLTCIATGALIAGHQVGLGPGVLACISGIFAGDLLLYAAGRFLGRPVLRWRPVRRALTAEKVDRASKWLRDRGPWVVIASRFTPGLRLPTYVAAGLLKTRFWTFMAYFLGAAVVWTPMLVIGSAVFGESLVRATLAGRKWVVAAVAVAGLLLWLRSRRRIFDWRIRRRIVGRLRRLTHWEFWPPWLTYLPLVPYLLYLGLRHRSLTLFTAANPGISSGGFVGESKSRILSQLTRVPCFTMIAAEFSAAARWERARAFMDEHGLSYPVVLKPDVGERGTGVVIARSADDIQSYLRAATADVILQQYVAGMEFGIFYYRFPGERTGRIFSITEKRFPEVMGDGTSTIRELILKDQRAVCLVDLYVSRMRRCPDEVPAAGESVRLAEIGSHFRGAVFLNGAHLETEVLRSAVDSAAKTHPGFYFGRFDVRADSIADLQACRFSILELNGVTAEATHVYDPSVSVIEAYGVMFRQWRIAFEIGARNRRGGFEPVRFVDLMRMVAIRN